MTFKQRHMVAYFEFFESQSPAEIERKLRSMMDKKQLPPARRFTLHIDHKNLAYKKKSRKQDGVGKDVTLHYVCPNDGHEWTGSGIKADNEYYIWAGSDACPVCGSRGTIVT